MDEPSRPTLGGGFLDWFQRASAFEQRTVLDEGILQFMKIRRSYIVFRSLRQSCALSNPPLSTNFCVMVQILRWADLCVILFQHFEIFFLFGCVGV